MAIFCPLAGEGDGGSGTGGGVAEGDFFEAIEAEAVVFRPVAVIDRSNELGAVVAGVVEDLGAVVFDEIFGLDGAGGGGGWRWCRRGGWLCRRGRRGRCGWRRVRGCRGGRVG